MRIHKEGYLSLVVVGIVLITLNVFGYLYFPTVLFWLILLGSIAFFIFILQFFRNPNRNFTLDETQVVSPADGKVVVIDRVTEGEYLKDDRIQISIFMSPLNVHLNRVPVSGEVEYYKYHPGKYMVAFHPKSSELNERNTTVIRTPAGYKLLMRQIAGAVARRISCYMREGMEVKQGEELGFIKFGSRMDVFLPLDAEIKVEMNQVLKGGVSVLAVLPNKEN